MVCNVCRKVGNFGSEARLRGFVCCVWMVSAKVLVSLRMFCCCSRAVKCLTFVLSFCWAMDWDSLVTYSMTPAILFWASTMARSICCCSSFIFVWYLDVQILEKVSVWENNEKGHNRGRKKKVLGFLTRLVSASVFVVDVHGICSFWLRLIIHFRVCIQSVWSGRGMCVFTFARIWSFEKILWKKRNEK